MRLPAFRTLAAAAALGQAVLLAAPAVAGNSLIPPAMPVAVAKSLLTVTPDREWNKLGARPGKNSETWTIDGDPLNDLTFYGGMIDGQTLFREVNKKERPLPLFKSTMLLTDIPALFEQSYRIANNTSLFTIDSVAPGTLNGINGVRFTYRFTRQDEDVQRQGEAVGAIVGGKLYMIAFEAPTLHYFDAGIAGARAVMASAKLPPA